MSLTNIVYTPVDTGTAKVSPRVEKTKVADFYLLAGQINVAGPGHPLHWRKEVHLPAHLVRFRYMVKVIPSSDTFITNSASEIFTNSSFCESSPVIVVNTFDL